MRLRIRLLLLALLGVLLAVGGVLGLRHWTASQSMQTRAERPHPVTKRPSGTSEPWIAAHYFGGHWAKNFLNGFRRADVAADFRQLHDDGFNTVILLVPWAELQPDIRTCCQFDARAFERLGFLIDQADAAGLKVILRLGYYWSFATDELDVRYHRLLINPALLPAWTAFLHEVQTRLASRPAVVMSFMSWEDLPVHAIDPTARSEYNAYLRSRHLPPLAAGSPLPRRDNAGTERFLGYWDWLLVNRTVIPASRILPGLSFESRIDKDAVTSTGADGKLATRWIGHEGTYRIPGARAAVFYWAPYWGAENHGERLDADRSLQLLRHLLEVVAAQVQGQSLFIDQLNVIDNTLGFDHNAQIDPQQIDAFFSKLPCMLKRNNVIGYGIWTVHDYRESPIYNPSFAYGLDDWTFSSAVPAVETTASGGGLQPLPSGDNQLRMRAGDVLTQVIPIERGRHGLPYRTCVTAIANAPSTLHVDIGAGQALLHFYRRGSQQVCASVPMLPPSDASVTLRLRLGSGDLTLRDVYLFDHVQQGNLYNEFGADGSMLNALRKANRAYLDPELNCTVH